MKRGISRILIGLFVFASLGGAQAVLAADTDVSQSVTLHIDEGFIGRPVTLDMFDGRVRLAWDSGDVLAPGDVTLTLSTSSEVSLVWSSSYLLGSRGVLLGMKEESSSTIGAWNVSTLDMRVPFGAWTRPAVVRQSGFVLTRVGAEARVRSAIVPIGMREGTATWYRYKKCRCAASPDFPKGTRLLVRRQDDPSKYTVLRVNDYGPDRSLFPTRAVDIDSKAFPDVGKISEGVIRVTVTPLDPSDPLWKLADISIQKKLPILQ